MAKNEKNSLDLEAGLKEETPESLTPMSAQSEEENDMTQIETKLFDTMPVPAFAVDERGIVQKWNQAIATLTGRDAEDVIGKKTWAGFSETKMRTPIETALVEEDGVTTEFEVTHAETGDVTQVTFSATPILNDDELIGITATLIPGGVGSSDEMSDLRGQIEAINKSQAVIEFEMDGTIITANENFLTTLGYELDEIQGQHHSMFVDDGFRMSSEYKQLLSSQSAELGNLVAQFVLTGMGHDAPMANTPVRRAVPQPPAPRAPQQRPVLRNGSANGNGNGHKHIDPKVAIPLEEDDMHTLKTF